MSYVIAITGDSASGKTTVGELLKYLLKNSLLLECDRYHRWERGDPHWTSYTHLNPEANNLDKMKMDILDLQNGNRIFQVEYDHTDGKFTEVKIEEPAENIIVCGLHSFYGSNYDFKIFMDTDPRLQIKWKINRDISKRNHTPEQVLKQIESRREDFERYVLPQKSLADLIVNLYPADNGHTSLALFIRRKYNLSCIVDDFYTVGAHPNVVNSVDPDFYIIKFDKYIDLLPDQSPAEYDFIDYILFAILRMKDQKISL